MVSPRSLVWSTFDCCTVGLVQAWIVAYLDWHTFGLAHIWIGLHLYWIMFGSMHLWIGAHLDQLMFESAHVWIAHFGLLPFWICACLDWHTFR